MTRNKEIKKFIQVCGASHSGTTMLDLMLGNSDNAFSCGEVYAWFRPSRLHHFELKCHCMQNPCPIWEKIGFVPEYRFIPTVFKELGVSFVIDSSKELCWVLNSQKWAVNSGVKVFNFVIWKNPINLAYSFWKRGHSLDIWRKEFVSYYGRYINMGIPFRAVNYNDLVSNPKQKLSEICAHVDMKYFEGKEKFWDKAPHHLFGSFGVTEQVLKRKSIIRSSDTFSPEFKRKIGTLEKMISLDQEVQHIINILKKWEISQSAHFSPDEQIHIPSRPYPFWYYAKRLKQKVKKYFPDKTTVPQKI